MATPRQRLLARLAQHRADLLAPLRQLDEATLTTVEVDHGLTARDLLAHVAHWDDYTRDQIEHVLAGVEQIRSITEAELDRQNAALAEETRVWTFDRALEAAQNDRERLLGAMERLTDAQLVRRRPNVVDGKAESQRLTLHRRMAARWRHDREHARQIARWRKKARPARAATPRSLLLAYLAATRDEVLTAAALVSDTERTTRSLAGEWTLRDLIGHVVDWEVVLADALAGRPVAPLPAEPDDWNARHAAARRGQPYEQVLADYGAVQEELAELARTADLRRLLFPEWERDAPAARWLAGWPDHAREHAAHIREGAGA